MGEQNITAKKEFSRAGFALLALGLVTTILQLLLSTVFTAMAYASGMEIPEWAIWVTTFVPLYLGGVPVALLILRKIPAEQKDPVKLSAKRFWTLMLIGMPIMYGGNILGNFLSALLSGGSAENVLLDYIMGNPLLTTLFAVIIAPFLEEYIFRKQIIDRLGKYGEKTAILFSALTFGLFHMNLFQFFYAFGLGLIFAYVYTRTRLLRYPVIMHMIINFMGSVIAPLLLRVLDLETLSALESGQADLTLLLQILPGLLLYLAYSLVLMGSVIGGFVLLMIRWKKREFSPAAQELPEGTERKTVYRNWGMILFIVFCSLMIVISLFSGLIA